MNESRSRVVIGTGAAARFILAFAAAMALVSPAQHAFASPTYVDLTPRQPTRPRQDAGALERRTEEYERALERHRARVGTSRVDAADELERAQAILGPPPSVWKRLGFPDRTSPAHAAQLSAGSTLLRDLAVRLESGATKIRAAFDEAERSLAADADVAEAKARLGHERADLSAHVQFTAEELRAIAHAVDIDGSVWARLRTYARQLTWRDPATRLAKLRAAQASWDLARRAPPIGSELTYTAPPQRAPAALPTETITPAYAAAGRGIEGLEDVTDGSELELSEDVTRRAASLGSVAAAYEFVKNQCSYEWYYGSLKGAAETLRGCSGNDADLASLLIALLRAQGVPARYVHGTVELPLVQVASLAGVLGDASTGDESTRVAAARDATLRVVEASGVPFEPVVSGGRVTAIRMAHVWVEAYLGFSDYRGAPAGRGTRQWAPLDPAIAGVPRAFARPPAIDAVAELGIDGESFTAEYVEGASTASPLELLRRDVARVLASNHAGSTYSDARRSVLTTPEAFGFVPGSLPYAVTRVHGEYAILPDPLRQRGRVTVSDSTGVVLDVTLPLHRMVAHRAALTYEPATPTDAGVIAESGGFYDAPAALVQLVPAVRIDGRSVAVGARPLGAGAPLKWTLELLLPDGSTRRIENATVAGNVIALGVGAPRNHHVEGPLFLDGDLDSQLTRFLYERAASYATGWSDAEDELADLMQVVLVRPTANVVFVENQVEVAEVLGVRQRLLFKGFEVDADLRNVIPIELVAGRGRTFLRVSGLEGSHREARVLEEGCGVAAISATGVLQEARRRGIPLLRLTASNAAVELARLSSTSDVIEDVRDHLARGREVLVPSMDLTVEDWTGSGYIVLDPSTGAGGYFLTGRVSGGRTIVSPWRWAADALLEWVRNPYGRPPTTDLTKITGLSKVVESDMQRVRVGTASAFPLKVLVYGQWKEGKDKTLSAPVVGAPVDFYRCDGDATDSQHPVCGDPALHARAAFDSSPQQMQELLTGSADEIVSRVEASSRRIARAVSDGNGFASVWVTPDPRIGNSAIQEMPSRGTVPQLLGYDKIMAVVWVDRGTRGMFPVILRDPFVVVAEPDVAARVEGPSRTVGGTAGIEIAGGLDAIVVDRFGNPRANEVLRWTSGAGGGKFVLPTRFGENIGATEGLALKILDETGVDSSQVPTLEVTTPTELPVNVSFIPGYGSGAGYYTTVTATTTGGLSHSVGIRVAQRSYAFTLGSRRDVWFGGIRGTRLAWPLAAAVYARTATGWTPVTSGVVIEQRTWSDAHPGAEVTTSVSIPQSGTAVLLPTYDYADEWQQFRWSATVTLPDGTPLRCDDEYGMNVWSGIVKVAFHAVDRFSATLALPGADRSWVLPSDQRLDVTITNPTERPLYVRANQPTTPVLYWNDGSAADPTLRAVRANGVGGWLGYSSGGQDFTLQAPVRSDGPGGKVAFSVLAPDWRPDMTSVMRTLTEESVTYVGTSMVTFAGPLRCSYYIAEHEFACVETLSGHDAVAVATVADAFSGNGGGRNQPACGYATERGPIPPGTYRIGEGIMGRNTGPLSFGLEPRAGTETCGRTGFMIHTGTYSEGCIVVREQTLETLNALGRGTLVVKPCKDGASCAAPTCEPAPGCCSPNGCPPDDHVQYVGSDATNTCHAVPSSCQ